jgi:hypothetical protein
MHRRIFIMSNVLGFKTVKEIEGTNFSSRRLWLCVEKNNDSHGLIQCFDDFTFPSNASLFTAHFEIKGKIDYDSQEFLDSELYKVAFAILESDFKCSVEELVPWSKFQIGGDSKLDKISMSFIFSDKFSYDVKEGYGNEKEEKSFGYMAGNIHSYVYKVSEEKEKNPLYVNLPDGKTEILVEELLKLRKDDVNHMDIIGNFKVNTIPCETKIKEVDSSDNNELDKIKVFRLCNLKKLYIGMDIDEYEGGEILKLKYWNEPNLFRKIHSFLKVNSLFKDALFRVERGENCIMQKEGSGWVHCTCETNEDGYNPNSVVISR